MHSNHVWLCFAFAISWIFSHSLFSLIWIKSCPIKQCIVFLEAIKIYELHQKYLLGWFAPRKYPPTTIKKLRKKEKISIDASTCKCARGLTTSSNFNVDAMFFLKWQGIESQSDPPYRIWFGCHVHMHGARLHTRYSLFPFINTNPSCIFDEMYLSLSGCLDLPTWEDLFKIGI